VAPSPPEVPLPLHAYLRVMDEPRRAVVRGAHTKKLKGSAHSSVKALAQDIEAWVANWNEDPKPFVWHKTAAEILERLAGYCSAVTENMSASS